MKRKKGIKEQREWKKEIMKENGKENTETRNG
jgi:hypothetical protein